MKTKSVDIVSNTDGTVTVEAMSPEDALKALHAELGQDAKILSAKRESRGGVGGFFATETFVVRASAVDKPTIDRDEALVPPAGIGGLGELLARVEADGDYGEVNFGEVLRKELSERGLRGDEQPAPIAEGKRVLQEPVIDLRDVAPSEEQRRAAALEARRRRAARTERLTRLREREQSEALRAPSQPEQIVEAPSGHSPQAKSIVTEESGTQTEQHTTTTRPSWQPAPVLQNPEISIPRAGLGVRIGHPAGAATGTGRVAWSLDALAYLGLPFSIVQDLVGLDPEDDMAWVEALAARLSSFCRPLPMRESVYVGPKAAALVPLLGVPAVMFPDDPPYGGSVCLRMDDDGAHRAWLSRVQGDRALHLVIGGTCWGDLLSKRPVAISYVGGSELLITALQLCVKHDIGLGYAVTPQGSFRVNPLDAALQIRSLLGRK